MLKIGILLITIDLKIGLEGSVGACYEELPAQTEPSSLLHSSTFIKSEHSGLNF